ncbi:MAG: hypothetical protein ACOY41_12890 [Pseudomonadota bacterium]
MSPSFNLASLRERLAWQGARLLLRQHFVLLLCGVACALMAYRAANLRQEVQAADSRLRYQAASTFGSSTDKPVVSQAQFLDFFPRQDPTEDFLKQVYNAAGKRGIKVSQVALEAAPSTVAGLNQQNVLMTLVSPDEAYRELVYTLLARTPTLALTRMSVNHNERGDFQVDLVWGMYSR